MTNYMGISGSSTFVAGALHVFFVLLLIHVFFMWPVIAVHGFVERKLGADLQARVGPNRVGPAGSFQAAADAIKLLQKRMGGKSAGTEVFWSICQLAALHALFASLPLASSLLLVDSDLSIMLPLWSFAAVSACGLLMGTARNQLPGWLSGLRGAFQGVSGLFPALISILAVGIHAGGFR
jgi:NADH-quinone oxidoreductase subunit H